eukprot:364254-Chlamydomonas_euryale.AAC.13
MKRQNACGCRGCSHPAPALNSLPTPKPTQGLECDQRRVHRDARCRWARGFAAAQRRLPVCWHAEAGRGDHQGGTEGEASPARYKLAGANWMVDGWTTMVGNKHGGNNSPLFPVCTAFRVFSLCMCIWLAVEVARRFGDVCVVGVDFEEAIKSMANTKLACHAESVPQPQWCWACHADRVSQP